MSTYLKGTDQRHKEFNEKLAKLLAEIKTAAEGQFRYNETENLPRKIVLPEDSVEHAIKNGIVHAINSHLHWDCFAAIDWAHSILEDANCHPEAKALLESSKEFKGYKL